MKDNNDLANWLEEMATLLEFAEENPFKIRSYKMAAASVRVQPTPIEKSKDLVELMLIPGVGKSIAEKLLEVIQTGSCAAYESLLLSFPRELFSLLPIAGLGPKRIAQIYKELGVRSIERLKEVAQNGEMEKLPGFGKKTALKILKSIEQHDEKKERFLLFNALPVAQELLAAMRAVPGVEKAEIAGSLRRWKETVKDLDILVTGAKEITGAVMAAFTSFPGVAEVLQQGETKAVVKLQMGIQVDLRFVESDCFGASMQYFTGSKEHNVALRSYAKDQGFKTSEYGLFDIARGGEIKIAGADEVEFYDRLGMSYIEPELRENTGEIAAALARKLPNLIMQADIRGDLHMHTTQSDGRNTLEDMIEAAMALGYQYIAITEHSQAMHIAHGLAEDRLLSWIDTIHKVNRNYRGFTVLAGIEVDIRKDGSLDLETEVLEKCDIVVASVHTSLQQPADEMTERILRALSHPVVNILAHPTARLIQERAPIEYDFEKVVDAATSHQVALEVNSSPFRLDLKDSHIRRVIEKKGLLAINTDSHHVDHLHFMELGIHQARRGWCQKKDCINTWGIQKLKEFLGKKKKKG